MLAFAGERVQAMLPRPLSLSDFVRWRYGSAVQYFVAFILVVNTLIGLMSEFSTMSSIWHSFVKATPYPIVVVIGVATLAYTAYGGLLISIVTDQFQGVFATGLLLILVGYLAIWFPRDLPPFPHDQLGATAAGWNTVFTLPTSMIASSFFSEAMWQRVWAAESRTALHRGAMLAAILISLAIGVLGLTGLLSTWAFDLHPSVDSDSPMANLYTFYVLGDNQYSWVGALIIVLAVTMNMSAIDSAMNALTCIISANFFRNKSLSFTRVLVIALSVPMIVVAAHPSRMVCGGHGGQTDTT
ncbi:hypothetical protein BCR44DRAFT_1099857 [Catenaria anguillulae PL171]|uniref:Uncharacterized protein n=1 Tax=Catenaria anguillulae PL171 TaxID=765915 RepID=A0A1Y2I1M2_9FUNG|nr:hypothetical protein BCR44DRAFT_1099857 [Catenaria anguillulae PL171]